MKRILAMAVAVLCVSTVGCFHATIDSGLAGNGEVITQKWASCWIFGLIPPKTVEAASKCPGGVSKVETQRSFLNGLVSVLTFSIYTPMEIVVTCAGTRAEAEVNIEDIELVLAANATPEEIREAYGRAATLAYQHDGAVYVRFAESGAETPGQ